MRRKQQFKFLVLGAAAAGKTSLLRRYFHQKFEYERHPTLGSDFYMGKVPYSASKDNEDKEEGPPEEITIQVQFWDTPGTLSKIHKKQARPAAHHFASLSDSFFRHADAVMLVYDMTSSTSFTRLLKWYADLMELFAKTGMRLPILIVANKLDLFQADKPGARHPPRRVEQREVLGLPKDYCGNDFRYEYSISTAATSTADVNNAASNNNNQASNGAGTSPQKQQQQQQSKKKFISSRKRSEISSYLVTRDNWTSDGSYLESLLHSEDGSHPDREMVLLWCMRNGLEFYEVSAATGEGVNEAMKALVSLALESSPPPPSLLLPAKNGEKSSAGAGPSRSRRNQELDLQQRYAPKEDNCFLVLQPFRNCMKNCKE